MSSTRYEVPACAGRDNIRVNSGHLGLIRTPMTEGIPDDLVTIPLGRPADSSEVATFILSPRPPSSAGIVVHAGSQAEQADRVSGPAGSRPGAQSPKAAKNVVVAATATASTSLSGSGSTPN